MNESEEMKIKELNEMVADLFKGRHASLAFFQINGGCTKEERLRLTAHLDNFDDFVFEFCKIFNEKDKAGK